VIAYNPNRFFRRLFASALGQRLWEFLVRPQTIAKMETACLCQRPAIEHVAHDLLREFGVEDLSNHVKRMIGQMARPIMESRGRRIVRRSVGISRNPVFTRGALYA
jgi:hypothetical protein